jgi:hypothetical protein
VTHGWQQDEGESWVDIDLSGSTGQICWGPPRGDVAQGGLDSCEVHAIDADHAEFVLGGLP